MSQGDTSLLKVRGVFSDFASAGAAAGAGEGVSEMKACLFQNGLLTKVYKDLQTTDNLEYSLGVNRLSGTLYMLADTEQLIDWNNLQPQSVTEEEWLQMAASSENGQPHPFWTGKVSLDSLASGKQTLSVNMKRGVARFDLLVRGTAISVHRLTLKNVRQQGYLFEQNAVSSPKDVTSDDWVCEFAAPLQKDSVGVAYVYEQKNPELMVSVDVSIAGRSYTLEEYLMEDVKRNTVYTLTVRKELLTEELRLEIEEWNKEGDIALTPDLNSAIHFDVESLVLPEGVSVNAGRDVMTLPASALDFELQIDCDNELEWINDPSLPFVVEPVGTTWQDANRFRLRKPLLPPGYPEEEALVRFRRKGLQGVYDEDSLKIVLLANPIQLEGELVFGKDDYLCDFARYVDNELGRMTLPEGYELLARFQNEDAWIKVEQVSARSNTYRVVGGWRPNDPKADGREQMATLVVRRISDGNETESYQIKRRNYGLPVTKMNGVWWCKYNAIGNSRSFDDQILVPQDPAAKAGKTVLEYLNTCTSDEYMRLWNRSAYIGDTGIGMEAVAEGGAVKLSGWKNPSVNMGQLDAKALAPDGYEMPAIEYYDRIFNGGWGMRFDRTDGYYTVQSPWEGRAHVYTLSGSRTDLFVGDVQLPELFHAEVYNKTNAVKDECVTFYGPGAQWGSGGVNHNKIVIACYSPENNGWFHAPGLRRQFIGKENSRIIRFIKSPVEYIY
ncbi:FimB/Mfa2 family fimbrial subunit [Phocaeicola coprophilus]|uniref:FimB/Mfa2 family fimbrial subunit n=1 Tax=Phocaeicola coprophilus TaxID=387090 RepID=UPI0026741C91|nr:FimB/Mfa2 family fimbrial subunit [Phocaeicola coprophilus]